jgi:flotillin
MLPDIVRAAAEPMANIGQLTVVSNDGASDLVKNVTRTVTEAGATVKGLTGIDIPDLLSKAMGTTGDAPQGPTKRGPSTPPAGGGPAGGGPTRGGTSRSTAAGGGTAGASPMSMSAGPTPAAGAAATPAPATPPRITTAEGVAAAMAGAEVAMRAAGASPAPRTDTAAGPARPAASARPAATPAPITRDTTVDEAARQLAADLRAVPGIERFGAVRLAELERGGPRPLRTMWRIARDQLDDRYGQVTIGELIDRYRGSSPTA